MRKLITTVFLGAFSLCILAENNPIFECKFNSKAEFKNWTVIDNNNDGETWILKELNAADSVAAYGYSAQNAADDWLISPPLTTTESGYYQLDYYYLGGSVSGEKMDLFYGTSNTVEAMTSPITDLGTFSTGSNLLLDRKLFKMEAGKTYFIGFHAKSDANRFRIYIDNVRLTKAISGIDAGISQIISPVSDYNLGQEEVTVTIKNYGPLAISNFPVAYSIDGDASVKETFEGTIQTGQTTNYTFKSKADLSVGGKKYALNVWTEIPEEAILANDTCKVEIKHQVPAQVPYFMGFEANQETNLISIYNLNDDSGKWSITTDGFMSSFSNNGECSMVYDYDKNNAGNDWFILEPISLKAGYYSLKFWYSTMGEHKEKLGIYYGTEKDPAKLTNTIVEYNALSSTKYVESANVVHIEKEGIYYFGFKAFSDKDENIICIDDISLNKISDIPVDVAVTAVTNPEHGYVRPQSSKDIVYSLSSIGYKEAKGCQLTVSIDGQPVKKESIDFSVQQTIKQTIADGLKNLETGKHTLKIELTKEGDGDPENNTTELSFKVVSDPNVFWDFENGKVPADFNLVKKDQGTINPQLAELFPNNEIWNTIGLDSNPVYGSWMIGSASFLNNAENADRWLILPKTKITSEDACLIWSACSMDGDFPEDYEIMVSQSDDNTDNFVSLYKQEKEVDAANITSRGIELGSYKDKSIYLAFRHTTKDGYVLVLDNIGFYNNAQSGIENTQNDSNFILIDAAGNTLHIEAKGIENTRIYGTSGNLLMQSGSESQLSISQLEKGVYILIINTKNGQSVHRFVKK